MFFLRYMLLMAALSFSGYAFADCSTTGATLGDVACIAESNIIESMAQILATCAYLAGAVFAIKGAILLKDHTENPGNVKLSKPLVAILVSGLLLGFPEFLTMLFETWNGGASDLMSAKVGFSGGGAAGGDAQTLSQMAQAFATNLPQLKSLIFYVGVVAGLFITLRAIFMLPQLEQGRAEPSKIIWTLIAGVALFSLMPMIDVAMQTMGSAADGSTRNILTAHLPGNGSAGGDATENFKNTILAVLSFIQLLGLIAFIRGCMILKMVGEHKDGAMGRAITHVFGGSAAINIQWTVKMLATSIGASWICGSASLSVLCG